MMRQVSRSTAFWYVAAIMGLATGLFAWRADSQVALADQFSNSLPSSGGLITHVHEMEGQKTRVIVIDLQTQAMGVYDIGQDKGEIQLKSVRRISADLQMLEFNSADPSPAEIQNRLDQR